MLITGLHAAIVPDYVLTHHEKYVTTKDLLILLQLQTIPTTTKESWELVAERMGYDNIGPIRRAVNTMEGNGMVVTSAYKIDARPLWDACKACAGDSEGLPEVAPIRNDESKPKKEKPRDHKIYRDNDFHLKIKSHGKSSFWQHLSRLKPIFEYEEDDDKIVNFVEYLYAWTNRNKGENDMWEGIWLDKLTLDNYEKWVSLGCPRHPKKKRISLG